MVTIRSMLGLLLVLLALVACNRQAPEHQVVLPKGDRVNIALETVNDGGVYFFTYKWEGKNINFFVRTDGSGKLQTHFDACYSCFKYKLGYVWEKDQVVCIACRIGYRLEDVVWDYVGACAPISFKSRISGQYLVIRRVLLEKGKKFF